MRIRHRLGRPAISALQLVVVLAIILLGLALLAPAVARVREAAARTQSLNNLKQLALGMHSYASANNNNMPPAIGEVGKLSGPAHYHILPYVDLQGIFDLADGASWKNQAYGKVVQIFLDPRDQSAPTHVYKKWLATTNYPVNWLLCKDGKVGINTIPDGASNTFMFAQRFQMCDGAPTAWGYPSIYTWAPMFAYYSDDAPQFMPTQARCDPQRPQSIGREILVGMADGSVRTVSPDISQRVWYNGCSPDDGAGFPIE